MLYLSQINEREKYIWSCVWLNMYYSLITWINIITKNVGVLKSRLRNTKVFKVVYRLNGIAQNLYLTENWGNGR